MRLEYLLEIYIYICIDLNIINNIGKLFYILSIRELLINDPMKPICNRDCDHAIENVISQNVSEKP